MPAWLLSSLATLFLWGLWTFLPKVATGYLNAQSTMVYQAAGSLPVILVLLAWLRFRPGLDGRGVAAALVAGVVGTLGTLLFVYAISKGKAAIVVPLTALYPIVTVLLSALVLHESITLRQGVGVLLALAAMLLLAL